MSAICVIKGDGVDGIINFKQNDNKSPVIISGVITGLKEGKHGFHVHEFGDTTNGCLSAGAHFNPFKKEHGSPNDENRHVGDLGNIESNQDKKSIINITDNIITLFGQNSIVGRSIVVHDKEDDLGRGNSQDSKITGNAGSRLGCGIIALSKI
ncbi:hypothetical protein ACTFIY_001269 [Dictyostelium cf. discoideum]